MKITPNGLPNDFNRPTNDSAPPEPVPPPPLIAKISISLSLNRSVTNSMISSAFCSTAWRPLSKSLPAPPRENGRKSFFSSGRLINSRSCSAVFKTHTSYPKPENVSAILEPA